MIDGDIFKIIVPLDDADADKAQIKRSDCAINCALIEKDVLHYLAEHPQATQVDVASAIGKSRRAVQDTIATLKEKGLLWREGARKNGQWVVKL